MISALLLAAVLRCTMPTHDAFPDSIGGLCAAGPVLLDERLVARLCILAAPPVVVDSIAGLEPGDSIFFEVDAEDGLQRSYYVQTRKESFSVWSCPSNLVTLNGRLAVEDQELGLWLGIPRPNPARDLVAIPLCLPEAGAGTLEVFDVHGRSVFASELRGKASGVRVVIWDARGASVGLYFVSLRLGTWRGVRRVLVLR